MNDQYRHLLLWQSAMQQLLKITKVEALAGCYAQQALGVETGDTPRIRFRPEDEGAAGFRDYVPPTFASLERDSLGRLSRSHEGYRVRQEKSVWARVVLCPSDVAGLDDE